MRRTPLWCLLGAMLPLVCAAAETDQEALSRATAAVEAAAPRAQTDPGRPIFHVMGKAQWMNDPNGPIFYQGQYHLFYQLHPYSDRDGTKYWGHVRSRDLVKWEHLPIALAPSNDKGEEAIWSGCCTLNGRGVPMIFYTSIGLGKSAFDHAEQWAARGDADLIHWQKCAENPVLSEALHGERKIYDWRDPFIFRDGQKTFLVTGGHLAKAGQAAVNIYEAETPELTRWVYRGVLFEIPDAPTAECPNFFKLGEHWVLFVSPYGKVQYFIGDFDPRSCRFTARTRGMLDYGPNFYAPNTLQMANGRRLVWGWVNGFPAGRGWNGCLSLPRQLSLSPEGQLRQTAAPQLRKLRGKPLGWRNLVGESSSLTLKLPASNSLEIQAEVELGKGGGFELKLANSDDAAQAVGVGFDGAQLRVMDVKAPFVLTDKDRKLTLRIFMDRSVLEVAANDSVWITKALPPLASGATLKIEGQGGQTRFKSVQAWPMHTIW